MRTIESDSRFGSRGRRDESQAFAQGTPLLQSTDRTTGAIGKVIAP